MQSWPAMAVTAPGLEGVLAQELQDLGISAGETLSGGVEFDANAAQIALCNMYLSTATHVWVRVAQFRVVHLTALVRHAGGIAWSQFFAGGTAVRVRAVCERSKIYHSGAAAERVAQAINAVCGPPAPDVLPSQEVLVRLSHDICTLSINSSGEPLYHRGYKLETAKAPLRETLAAGLLRLCAWRPGEPLLDPMCGSGTLVLEAAGRAAGLAPGRLRAFAWQDWPLLRGINLPSLAGRAGMAVATPLWAFDRDAGAIAATRANAERAAVGGAIEVVCQSLTRLQRPPGPAGLVVCNPPYGQRIGDVRALQNLYAALGNVMRGPLSGWRLGLITTAPRLAQATGLTFSSVSVPLPHGGLKIRLYQTAQNRQFTPGQTQAG